MVVNFISWNVFETMSIMDICWEKAGCKECREYAECIEATTISKIFEHYNYSH